MNDPIIQVNSLVKKFRIYHDRPLTMQQAFYNLIRGRRLYQEILALDGVTLEFKKAQAYGLIGPNASGKSTLLRILAGIYTATSGSIDIRGKTVACLELGAGFSVEFTGLENIFFYGAVFGLLRRQIRQKLPLISEFSELGDFMDAPVRQYSFGMRMRLAFAIAVNLDPDILLIDETLAVGDLGFKEKCYAKIEELKKSGKTLILVSQHMDEIERLCDEVVLLDKGKVLSRGQALEMIHSYKTIMRE